MDKKLWLIILGLWLLVGCTSRAEKDALQQDMLAYLNTIDEAQQQAAAQWDELIIGEGVNCQQGLLVPQPFDLNQTQANRFPEAAAVRDHLNQAVVHLTESARLWDVMCDDLNPIVSPQQANQGYLAVTDAKTELDLAVGLWNTWKS